MTGAKVIRSGSILFSLDHSIESHRLYKYLKSRGLFPLPVEGGTAEIVYQTSLKRPDLLILYHSPPDIEPNEICKILKGQIETQSILILVLDGKDEKVKKLEAFGLSADAYASRFLPVEELYAKVYSLLSIRELHLRLLESEKFAALGRLADRIAHEFRNPLTVIGGFAYRIRKKHPHDPLCQEYVGRIIREVHRLERIIDQITEFEMPARENGEYVDLVLLLREMADQFRAVVETIPGKSVKIEVPESDELPLIRASSTGMRTVFTNLFENAIEAIPEGRKGWIRVDAGMDVEEGILWLKIRDNGIGIPPEELSKVMDPFYTTKPYRIGLGLTLVYQHIRDLQGRVDIQSETGKGTVVTITLPMVLKAPLPPSRPAKP